MPKVTMVLTGDRQLNRKLKRLTSKQQKAAFREAARPAIKPVGQEAKSNAKENKDTGALAKSIKVRSIKRSRSRIGVRVTTRTEDFKEGRFYASFQEYGWKAGNTRVKGRENLTKAANKKGRLALKNYKLLMRLAIKEQAEKIG